MDKEYVLWLLGIAQAILFMGGGFILRGHISFSNRLTRLETMWSMINKQAAEILHSPHFKESGFDELLEQFSKAYEEHDHQLSKDEWNQLMTMSQRVKEDVAEPKGTRFLAAIVYTQCCQQLKEVK